MSHILPPGATPYSYGLASSKLGANILKEYQGGPIANVGFSQGYVVDTISARIENYGPYIFIKPPSNFGWSDNTFPTSPPPATVEAFQPDMWFVNQAMKTYYQTGSGSVLVPGIGYVTTPDLGMAGYVDDDNFGKGIYVDFRLHFKFATNEVTNNQYGAVDGKAGDWVRILKNGTYQIIRENDVQAYENHSALHNYGDKTNLNKFIFQYWWGIA